MKWIKAHKVLFFAGVLPVLLGLVIFLFPETLQPFLISKADAIHTALGQCGTPVVDKGPLDAQAHISFYSHKTMPPRDRKPESKLFLAWIVTVDGDWSVSGGPVNPGDPPLTLTVSERCTVTINAVTGDVIVVHAPTLQ